MQMFYAHPAGVTRVRVRVSRVRVSRVRVSRVRVSRVRVSRVRVSRVRVSRVRVRVSRVIRKYDICIRIQMYSFSHSKGVVWHLLMTYRRFFDL